MLHTHSQRLEKWIGAAQIEELSRQMLNWYGPPIAVGGVPGAVYVARGGDFIGEYKGSREVCAVERGMHLMRELERQRFKRRFAQQIGAFSGLSALIAAKTGGKGCTMLFNKPSTAATAIGGAMDLWTIVGQPGAGAAGGAAPTGTSPTSATAGAMPFVNAVGTADTSHFINATVGASVAGNTLLLYDRLLSVAKTMNSTATEAVSGTFSRYQSGTATAANYIGGNFLFPSNPTTVLAATAHNWTVCQYTNQASVAAQSAPSIAGISACAVHQVDLAVNNWFMPLAAGDVGVKALTQMQCSALVATGTVDFVVGHPIVVMPCPLAVVITSVDGLTTAFNLQTIYDNACLAFLELPKTAATATIYTGIISTVSE